MRELDFNNRGLDYRTFVSAIFCFPAGDGKHYTKSRVDVVVCEDPDEDDDVGALWYSSFAELEADRRLVSYEVVSRDSNIGFVNDDMCHDFRPVEDSAW